MPHHDHLIAEYVALSEELASLGLELERLKHNPASTEEHAAYWRWFVAFMERLDDTSNDSTCVLRGHLRPPE